MNAILSMLLEVLPYLLFAGGAYMVVKGAGVWIAGAGRDKGSNARLLRMVMGFRQAIVGLALIGFGFWLLTRETWVLVLSLTVAGEEVFETGTIIKALRSDPRLREPGPRERSPQLRGAPSRSARGQARPAS